MLKSRTDMYGQTLTWRNWLAQVSYTHEVVGSSPAVSTLMIYGNSSMDEKGAY